MLLILNAAQARSMPEAHTARAPFLKCVGYVFGNERDTRCLPDQLMFC